MAEAVNVEPSKPRTCVRQRNRSNASPLTDTIEEWYKVNITIPFLDHVIAELESQFSLMAQTASQLLGLVPSIMCSKDLDMSEAVQLYHQDLPSPELFDQEFMRWRDMYSHKPVEERPATSATALKECDKHLFPNITTLLQIVCTLPVTSAECERNASVLRRLHNFMRAGMNKNRLTSLALMHIHYQHKVDLDTVVQLFAESQPRRLQFFLNQTHNSVCVHVSLYCQFYGTTFE